MDDKDVENGGGSSDEVGKGPNLRVYAVPPRNFGPEPCPNLAEFCNSRAVTREELLKLFNVLINIRNLTDPARGPVSLVYKHDRARDAILFANHLALGLAGWAYNHIAGHALEPAVSPNSHQHEENGRRIEAAHFAGERKCSRSVLADMVESVQEFFPDDLGRQLAHGLRGLEFGEVFPLLAPKKPKLPGQGYTVWNLRLAAVCHWHHLQALGERSEMALEKVAEAFGETTHAVKMWDYRVSDIFGAATVNVSIEIAKHAAKIKLRHSSDSTFETMSEIDQASLELYKEGSLQVFGDLNKRREK